MTGKIQATATQTASTTTSAKGAAKGDVAIGAALALAVVDDRVSATDARSLTAHDAITFSAIGSSTNTSSTEAAAKGAEQGSSTTGKDSSNKDVNGKADSLLSLGNLLKSDNNTSGQDTGQNSTPKAATGSKDNPSSSSDSSSSVKVAAAALQCRKFACFQAASRYRHPPNTRYMPRFTCLGRCSPETN